VLEGPDHLACEQAAARLRVAEETGVPCAPVRDLLGGLAIRAAYEVQEINASLEIERGARISGWKIGLTSEAVRSQLGVAEPDFGVLFEHRGVADGGRVDLGALLQPRIEAEIGFVLGSDLSGQPVDADMVRAATSHVVAILEIPDSRVAGWDIAISDTVADNASSGRYVVGSNRVSLDSVDLGGLAMELRTGGRVVSSGTGRASMGDPVHAVVWLANTLIGLGKSLRAGEIVLSGALGAMVTVTSPSVFTATLGELGEVCVEFVNR
jgi:2-keto-4-pentenoate hydratase